MNTPLSLALAHTYILDQWAISNKPRSKAWMKSRDRLQGIIRTALSLSYTDHKQYCFLVYGDSNPV